MSDSGKSGNEIASSSLSLTYPKNVKILVVEDNELNRFVAQSVLKKIGWELELVEDGIQALKKLKSTAFDLILMDIQMPEMDGFETTEKIRKEFSAPLSTIPIIACTAHPGGAELKRCMEVGMNDYISKPFKQEELINKVVALINKNASAQTSTINILEGNLTMKEEESVINLQNLLTLSGNNKATVKNIINVFLQQAPERLEELIKSMADKDWVSVKNLSHKMKSSYALIGATASKKILETIEEDCMHNRVEEAKFKLLLDKFIQLDSQVIKSIQTEVN